MFTKNKLNMIETKPTTEIQAARRPAPARRRPGVQVRRVDHPGDERAGLLRIPAPVPTPGHLGPHRAGDHRERVHRERHDRGPVGDPIQRGRRRQPAEQSNPTPRRAGPIASAAAIDRGFAGRQTRLLAVVAAPQQVQHRRRAADHQHAGGQRDGGDVNPLPVRVQRRHHRRGRHVQHGAGDEQQDHHRQHDEHAHRAGAGPGQHDQPAQHGRPRRSPR